jgi:hypothetical protein
MAALPGLPFSCYVVPLLRGMKGSLSLLSLLSSLLFSLLKIPV